ncbi:MAG: ribosome-binding factor A [Patescibacteria group bacterium]
MIEKSPFRHDRTEQLLKELAARFLQEESNGQSLITVTSCKLSRDGNRVTFFVSVLPASAEEGVAEFIKRKRGEFREYLKKHSRIGRLPFVEMLIDKGEKNRQRVDELLDEDKNG